MIVAYEFNYLNENALIAHFLLFYARKSALEFCLKKEASLISLFVSGGEDEILKFSRLFYIKILFKIPGAVLNLKRKTPSRRRG